MYHSAREPSPLDGTEARLSVSHHAAGKGGDTSEGAPWSQVSEWYGHIRMFSLRSSTSSETAVRCGGKVMRICTLPASGNGRQLVGTADRPQDHQNIKISSLHGRDCVLLTSSV